MRRAISPVIATVIIVAVAIAISIAVAGWLMGLWGGFGQTESLKIFPDSYIDSANDQLILHIQNVGGSPAQIYKIEVSGNEIALTGTNIVNDPDGVFDANTNTIILNPGQEATITIAIADDNGTIILDAQAGVAYTVTIYTEAGNVYTSTVYGK